MTRVRFLPVPKEASDCSEDDEEDDGGSPKDLATLENLHRANLIARCAPISRFKVAATLCVVISRFRTQANRRIKFTHKAKHGRRLDKPLSDQEELFVSKMLCSTGLMAKSTRAVEDVFLASKGEELDTALSWLHKMKIYTARACWHDSSERLQRQLETLRADYTQLNDQFKTVRVEYLREVASLRDHVRVRGDPEQGLPSFEATSYFSPECTLTPAELEYFGMALTEKLKMIFDTNPSVTATIDFGQIERLKNRVENHQLELAKRELHDAKQEIAALEQVLQPDQRSNKLKMVLADEVEELRQLLDDRGKRLAEAEEETRQAKEEISLLHHSLRTRGDALENLRSEIESLKFSSSVHMEDLKRQHKSQLFKQWQGAEEQRHEVEVLRDIINQLEQQESFRKELRRLRVTRNLRRPHAGHEQQNDECDVPNAAPAATLSVAAGSATANAMDQTGRGTPEGDGHLHEAPAMVDLQHARELAGQGKEDINAADAMGCLERACTPGNNAILLESRDQMATTTSGCVDFLGDSSVDYFSAPAETIFTQKIASAKDLEDSAELSQGLHKTCDASPGQSMVRQITEPEPEHCQEVCTHPADPLEIDTTGTADLEDRCQQLKEQCQQLEERCQHLERLLSAQLHEGAQRHSELEVETAEDLAKHASALGCDRIEDLAPHGDHVDIGSHLPWNANTSECRDQVAQVQETITELETNQRAAEEQLWSQLPGINVTDSEQVDKVCELGQQCAAIEQQKQKTKASFLCAQVEEVKLETQGRILAPDTSQNCGCSCMEELESTKTLLARVQVLASELAAKLKASAEENLQKHAVLTEVQETLRTSMCSLQPGKLDICKPDHSWGRSVSEGADPQPEANELKMDALKALVKTSKTVFHRLYHSYFLSKCRRESNAKQLWDRMEAALLRKYAYPKQTGQSSFVHELSSKKFAPFHVESLTPRAPQPVLRPVPPSNPRQRPQLSMRGSASFPKTSESSPAKEQLSIPQERGSMYGRRNLLPLAPLEVNAGFVPLPEIDFFSTSRRPSVCRSSTNSPSLPKIRTHSTSPRRDSSQDARNAIAPGGSARRSVSKSPDARAGRMLSIP